MILESLDEMTLEAILVNSRQAHSCQWAGLAVLSVLIQRQKERLEAAPRRQVLYAK